MPAKDSYHDQFVNALIKDGWTITHDPFTLALGGRDVYVDLGAERLIAAEKGIEKIAVEIKCFFGASDLRDFEAALGQFVFYRSLIERAEPSRKLYLAVPASIFSTTMKEPIVQPALSDLSVHLIAFDPDKEIITQWKT
jgi:XisH protein